MLSARPEGEAATAEYASFLRCTGLTGDRLHLLRLDATPGARPDLSGYAGVFLGGSPFTVSTPPERKSALQRRVEADIAALLDEIVPRDLPFFGACFGVGTVGAHQGGLVDSTYAEQVAAVPVTLTDAGMADPVLAGLPEVFDAYVSHKEACTELPRGAVLLATSAACPVQAYRLGSNVYVTQFHPELDLPALLARCRVYLGHGYVPEGGMAALELSLRGRSVAEPARMLRAFAERYGRSGSPVRVGGAVDGVPASTPATSGGE